MSSIDERVVELQFDNGQFESGVQQSLGTLDKLRNALNLGASAQGLKGLGNAGKSLGDAGLGNVSSALDAVTNKFSLFGTVGDQVIRRLTDTVMGFSRKVLTAIPNQIIEGGKKRSQNISNAQFQLKGLMKEAYDWKSISEDISYAVQDTAYGFDEAALAASQYYASGIQFGEQMKESLRAISGVAAMTNSSYSDTARIFTTVAGQGRLMGDQLNQLANRGLNVAAILGETMNKSEKEIRDMVSKGQIDFETFAHVMDQSFGPHAKEAEKTFNGALANMKASLSRMGEQFATPTYEALRRTFIGVKGVFKQFEQLLKPVSGAFEVLSEAAADAAEKGLKVVADYLSSLVPEDLTGTIYDVQNAVREFFGITPKFNDVVDEANYRAKSGIEKIKKAFGVTEETVIGVTDETKKTEEALGSLGDKAEATDEIIQKVLNGDYGNGEERRKKLEAEGFIYEEIQNGVNEILGCSKRWEVSQENSAEKSEEIAKSTKETSKNTEEVKKNVEKTRFEKLTKGLTGVKSALKTLKSLGSSIYKNLIQPALSWAVPKVIDGFLTMFSGIGTALTEFDVWSSGHNFFDGITKRINDFASTTTGKLGEFLDTVKNLEGVKALGSAFKTLGDSLKSLAGGAVDKIATMFDSLVGGIKNFNVGKSNPIVTFIGAISSVAAGGVRGFSTLVSNIGSFIDKTSKLDGVKKLVDTFVKLKDVVGGFFTDKLNAITDWLSGFNLEGKAFDPNSWTVITDAINKVTTSVAGFIDDTLAGKTVLSDIFGFLSGAGKTAVDVLTSLGKGFLGVVKSAKDSTLLKNLGDSFKKLGEGIDSFSKNGVKAFAGSALGNAVKNFIRNFLIPLKTDPAAVVSKLLDTLKSLPQKIKDIFSKISIGDLVKKMFGKSDSGEDKGFVEGLFDDINPSAISTKISTALSKVDIIGTIRGIFKSKAKGEDLGQEIVDETLGDSESLYEKAKNSIKGIGDAIKDAFEGVEWGEIGKWAALATAGFMIFKFVSFIASAAKLAVSIPLGSIKALDTMKSSLKAYEAQVKSEALINVSKAIFIFAAALVVLAQVPSDKLDSVVGTVASLALLGVLIAAFYTRMKAAYGQMKAMPVNPLVMSIQSLLFGIKQAVLRAGNLIGVAAIIIAVGVAVGMLVHTLDTLVSNKAVLDNSQDALNVLTHIAVIIAGIGAAMGVAGKYFTGGSGVAVYLIAASIERLVKLLVALVTFKPLIDNSQDALNTLAQIATILALVGVAIGVAGKNFGVGSGVGIILMELAIERLANVMMMLANLPDTNLDELWKSVELIGALAAILTGMGAILGQLPVEKMASVSAAIVGMAAGMLLLCVPILLLSKVPVEQLAQGITAVGVAFMILVFAGYAANGAAVGLAAISGVLMGIASAMVSFALAAAIFGAALYLVGGGLDFFLGVLPSIGEKLGALLGPMLAALADLVVNLINGLKIMITNVYNWFITNGPTVIGKALAYLIKFMVFDIWVYGFKLLGAINNFLGQMANSFWSTIMDMTSGARAKLDYVLDSFSLWLFEGIRNVFDGLLKMLHLDDDVDKIIENLKASMAQHESEVKESTEGLGEAGSEGLENGKKEIDKSLEEIEKSVGDMEVDTSGAEQSMNNGMAGMAAVMEQYKSTMQEEGQGLMDPNQLFGDTSYIQGLWQTFGSSAPTGLQKGMEEGKSQVQTGFMDLIAPMLDPESNGINITGSTSGFVDSWIGDISNQFGDADMTGVLNNFFGQFENYSVDGSGMSKNGMELGKQVPESIGKGINDYKDIPLDNMQDLMDSLTNPNGVDVKSQFYDLGTYLPLGAKEGILANVSDATGAAGDMATEVLNTLRSTWGIASPSKETNDMGTNLDEGVANGMKSSIGTVRASAIAVALAALSAVASKVPLFKPYGVSGGVYFANGLLSKKGAASAAGSALAAAAASGLSQSLWKAKSPGIALGDKFVEGVLSKKDAAYRAGKTLAEETIRGFEANLKFPKVKAPEVGGSGGLDTVELMLGNTSSDSEIRNQAIEGLKRPIEIIKQILEDGIDINPTITPVLDLTEIKNGVGAINGLISPSTVNLGRLNASINASRGSDDKVIEAINSLKAGLDKPAGNTYIIEGITYDDGSNVSDAVRTLVSAARKRRRA